MIDKRDNEPRFDRLNTGNYSSFGKQPSVSLLWGDQESSSFLEIHLSTLNQLRYQILILRGQEIEVPATYGSVGEGFDMNFALSFKQMKIKDSNATLIVFENIHG